MKGKKTSLERQLVKSKVTPKDWRKIKTDLLFITLITKQAKKGGYRVIISGGYAVDGFLGQITRPHRDIDIQVYGQSHKGKQIVEKLIEGIKTGKPSLSELTVKDKGRQEFYHAFFVEGNGLGADIYYIQVAGNPLGRQKYVVKEDGSRTQKQEYDTCRVKLEGIDFEAVSPTSELVDKLYKRNIRGDKPKSEHDQDILNLKLVTDAVEVDSKLKAL